jgi:hypothetical protein
MGWLFSSNWREKADIVDFRIKNWSNEREIAGEPVIVAGKCLAHSVRGNNLWTVWETTCTKVGATEPYSVRRWIGFDLLSKSDGEYGYKDMEESVHPYYYDCPLSFLNMVPEVTSQAWRDKVRAFHAAKQAKSKKRAEIKVGDKIKLVNATIPEVTVVAKEKAKILGAYQGRVYRISPRFIGEVVSGS